MRGRKFIVGIGTLVAVVIVTTALVFGIATQHLLGAHAASPANCYIEHEQVMKEVSTSVHGDTITAKLIGLYSDDGGGFFCNQFAARIEVNITRGQAQDFDYELALGDGNDPYCQTGYDGGTLHVTGNGTYSAQTNYQNNTATAVYGEARALPVPSGGGNGADTGCIGTATSV